MKIALISDTHCQHSKITENLLDNSPDMIIHAGDATNVKDSMMNMMEMDIFYKWFSLFRNTKTIFVPGNHDVSIGRGLFDYSKYYTVKTLINDMVEVEGVKIWGSPYTPSFGQGWAYNQSRSSLGQFWEKNIPEEVDIIITHGPPYGVLDLTINKTKKDWERVGCKGLMKTIEKRKPKLVVFGHLHDEDDKMIKNNGTFIKDGITYVNASILSLKHQRINDPIYFEI